MRRLLVVSHETVNLGPQGKHRGFNSLHSHFKVRLKKNLEFLCPNCHATTAGWSGKKISGCGGTVDAAA